MHFPPQPADQQLRARSSNPPPTTTHRGGRRRGMNSSVNFDFKLWTGRLTVRGGDDGDVEKIVARGGRGGDEEMSERERRKTGDKANML